MQQNPICPFHTSALGYMLEVCVRLCMPKDREPTHLHPDTTCRVIAGCRMQVHLVHRLPSFLGLDCLFNRVQHEERAHLRTAVW